MICEAEKSSQCGRFLSEQALQLCDSTRELRRRMNVSQRQFARLAGTTKRTVARWEASQNSPSRLKRFRLEKLWRLVESIDMRDRPEPPQFIDRRETMILSFDARIFAAVNSQTARSGSSG